MKNWAVVFLMCVGITSIIIGNYYYHEKLENIAISAENQYQLKLEEQKEREEDEQKRKVEELERRLSKLTTGLPSDVRSLITSKYMRDEEIHIVAFGSRSLVDSQNEGIIPWPELLEKDLNASYDKKNLFQVETKSYGTLTSLQVLNEERHIEVAELQPDIIIIEPFIWNDNGEVAVYDTIQGVEMMTRFFQREIENVILFVQPAQPVHGTLYYPQYVEELKEGVQEMGLIFIDHWQDWPDTNDEELLLYTNEEHRMPNQEGHQLWSDSVSKFFLNN